MATETDGGTTDRTELLEDVADRQYDVVVVGAGIAGAGVARDAARRGMDVLLLEQNDFGAGTTAGSTRLIHGGLRYLEQYEFGLVFEGLRERETLADIAPHLVDSLAFVIPQYDESWRERLKLRLGMYLYDLLAYRSTMPSHDRLSRDGLQSYEPSLPDDGLQGGFVYHDRQCEFVERLCVENVLDASDHGADVLNHAAAVDLQTASAMAAATDASPVTGTDLDRVTGVTLEDGITGRTVTVDADCVVNATGPWADDVFPETAGRNLVRPAKGIHLVVPSLTDHAITLPTTDGRVLFVVPWNGLSLIGTTDTDYEGDPGDAVATREDVDYILGELDRYGIGLDVEDVLYTWAGVRPLYDEGGEGDSASVSREHRVVEHGDTCAGLFSLIGAKITPYRRAAADCTDAVADHLGVDAECDTADVALPGGRGDSSELGEVDADVELSDETLAHLQQLYGARAEIVLDRIEDDPSLAEPLCSHTNDVLAQVTLAVEEEHARRLTDVVFDRCTVGFAECEGEDAVEDVADHMASLLDWDEDRREAEMTRYEARLEGRHAFAEERSSAGSVAQDS